MMLEVDLKEQQRIDGLLGSLWITYLDLAIDGLFGSSMET
jgi:hypothetical protein